MDMLNGYLKTDRQVIADVLHTLVHRSALNYSSQPAAFQGHRQAFEGPVNSLHTLVGTFLQHISITFPIYNFDWLCLRCNVNKLLYQYD